MDINYSNHQVMTNEVNSSQISGTTATTIQIGIFPCLPYNIEKDGFELVLEKRFVGNKILTPKWDINTLNSILYSLFIAFVMYRLSKRVIPKFYSFLTKNVQFS